MVDQATKVDLCSSGSDPFRFLVTVSIRVVMCWPGDTRKHASPFKDFFQKEKSLAMVDQFIKIDLFSFGSDPFGFLVTV